MSRSIFQLLFVAIAGCSLQTTGVAECRLNRDCRQAFGIGSVCASDGFCELAAANPRCTQTFPPDLFESANLENVVVIGSIEQRSEDIFRSFERALQLALRQANQAGGIDGVQLAAVFCTIEDGFDDGLDLTGAAVESARYLADVVGVPAIVGPARSSVTLAVFQALLALTPPGEDGTLVISPSATSNALSDLDPASVSDESPGLLWRTAPPDSLQGFAIASDMGQAGVDNGGRLVVVDNAAVIHEIGPYGDGLAASFGADFAGSELSLHPFGNPTERDQVITEVAADPAIEEVLFVSGVVDDSVAFFDLAATLAGFDDKTLFVPDAAATSDVLEEADGARFGQVRGSRPAPLDERTDLVYADFLAKYRLEFSEDAEQFSFTANAYDAGWLAAAGAAWALLQEDRVSGVTMARGLRRLSAGDAVNVGPLGWNAVIQRLREGGTLDLQGASGELDYDPDTEETTSPIEIWQISGTGVEGIYQIDPPQD